ncbi:MAG: von Willebrand factor type A domain-containing protein [Opitutales bacterium]
MMLNVKTRLLILILYFALVTGLVANPALERKLPELPFEDAPLSNIVAEVNEHLPSTFELSLGDGGSEARGYTFIFPGGTLYDFLVYIGERHDIGAQLQESGAVLVANELTFEDLQQLVLDRIDLPTASLTKLLPLIESALNAARDPQAIPFELSLKPKLIPEYGNPRIAFTGKGISAVELFDRLLEREGFDWGVYGREIRVFPSPKTIEKAVSRMRLNESRSAGSDPNPRANLFAPLSAAAGAVRSPSGRAIRAPATFPSDPSNPVVGPPDPDWNTERYDRIERNSFRSPRVAPLSTFSLDVDTASYSNARRFILQQDKLPPWDAVRTEEFVNYFPYQTAAPGPEAEFPLNVELEVAPAPWKPEHRLVRVAVKGKELDWERRAANNLVFLLDVSGSMRAANKLPLVKDSLGYLVEQLDGRDRVAIVVYAGASGVVLEPTSGADGKAILDAMDRLQAGGSTNAGAGIELAYDLTAEHFIEGGNNRVILCTDGDFNVGTTNRGELTRMVRQRADKGIQLTVLGYGMGNLRDDMLETLTNEGDGTYAYIDSRREARKVFVEELTGSLYTIARDAKIQVEFNPAGVQAYRLVGYENRLLKPEDFNDDTVDAGEIGAGHSVIAFYEIIPPGEAFDERLVDDLKYQQTSAVAEDAGDELLTVKLRVKLPEAESSELREFPLVDSGKTLDEASADFRFASAAAGFAMLLSNDPHLGELTYDDVRKLASQSLNAHTDEYRREFVTLVDRVANLTDR